MTVRRVLLTGFEPFADHEQNISQVVVGALHGSGVAGCELSCRILSVDQAGSREVADSLLTEGGWDAVVQLGLNEFADSISVEMIAHNRMEMRTEDISGRLVRDEAIVDGGPESIAATALLERLPSNPPFPYHLSSDAGGFVCNETYYRTLHAIRESRAIDRMGRILPAVFIHLPPASAIPSDWQAEFVGWLISNITQREVLDVVAAVILREDGSLLCCRRGPDQTHPGCWEFPGGKLREAESAEEGLQRELLEELGLNIRVEEELMQIEHDYQEYHVQLRVFSCCLVDDDDALSLSVHDRAEWLRPEQAAELQWLEADIPIISSLQSNHS